MNEVADFNKAEQLILDQAKRILERRLLKARQILGSTEDLKAYLALNYGEEQDEMFGAVLLDSNYGLIGIEEFFKGTVNSVTIHTRPIVRKALDANASYAVLFHNHPSGNPKASDGDIEQTWKISDALKGIEVTVLDHMIVAGAEVSSFVEQNLETSKEEVST